MAPPHRCHLGRDVSYYRRHRDYGPTDWRDQATQPGGQSPSNQARRERAEGGYPSQDDLVFGSRAELAVYHVLAEIQRECSVRKAIAVLPLPGAKLRDSGVRTPDFVVIGNGRAVVIEVDGPHHYGRTRKADDATRDRHWGRCEVSTIRITSEHADDPNPSRHSSRKTSGASYGGA